MKLILICYHANISKLYPAEWIEEFKDSILNQTYQDFSIMECNYGGGTERIFDESIYESKKLPTFIDAMNYLIGKALKEGANVICNSNVDDRYSPQWLETQVPYLKKFDIVSCNFSLMNENGVYHNHYFDQLDIKENLNRNNNLIAHPAVLYSKRFLENNRYVPTEFPVEDMLLWKRTIDNYKFLIVKENLLYHRIHHNSVCKSDNR